MNVGIIVAIASLIFFLYMGAALFGTMYLNYTLRRRKESIDERGGLEAIPERERLAFERLDRRAESVTRLHLIGVAIFIILWISLMALSFAETAE